jgi:hypothetical protein
MVYDERMTDKRPAVLMIQERANAQSIASTTRTLKELFGI